MAMLQNVEASSIVVPPKKYDVFISFRGEDTSRNFTGHLYDALSKKVITFMDDIDLEKGDEISSSLIKAIEESYSSIVIFSKDYASSKRCLNELVKIIECKKELGQIVIPVFYGISPSNVNLQLGSFGEGFIKHEQDLQHSRSNLHKWKKDALPGQALIKQEQDLEHSKDKLQKWKAALCEAANLAGWDYQNWRIESHFIQLIVKDVSKKVNTKLVEIEKKYEEKSSLKGGTGKTKLAAKVINSVKKAMSLSISFSTTKPYLKVDTEIKIQQQIPNISVASPRSCGPKESSEENELQEKRSKLDKGSPVIIIEAPKMIKTASNSVYWPNFGLYKRGDVGRIVSKKQEDVWAVRRSIGTYIIDGKYFKPLDLAQ